MKYIIRRYPDRTNENETSAVAAAIAETERMTAGSDRLKIAKLVLMDGSHTLAGAALQIPCSERTAQRYHADFIRTVGKHFRCDSLLSHQSAEDRHIGELGQERRRKTEACLAGCFEPESEGKRPGYVPNPQRD